MMQQVFTNHKCHIIVEQKKYISHHREATKERSGVGAGLIALITIHKSYFYLMVRTDKMCSCKASYNHLLIGGDQRL